MLDLIAYMTWKNPVFMLIFFGMLWYLPGIIVRRRSEFLYLKKKEAARIFTGAQMPINFHLLLCRSKNLRYINI